jgi:hypothetical protein
MTDIDLNQWSLNVHVADGDEDGSDRIIGTYPSREAALAVARTVGLAFHETLELIHPYTVNERGVVSATCETVR